MFFAPVVAHLADPFIDEGRGGPVFPLANEVLAHGGEFRDEVVLLGAVFIDVVELPRAFELLYELPRPGTHGAVALVHPEDRLHAMQRLAVNGRKQRQTFGGQDFVPFELRWIDRAGHVTDCGHDVDEMRGLVLQLAISIRRNARRPMRDEGRADAAFVREVFIPAEGCVVQRGPGHAEEDIAVRAAEHLALRDATRAALGIAAVVAHEKDERVLIQAAFLQPGDHAADALIHAFEHGRVDSHEVIVAVLVLLAERIPRGHIRRTRAERPFRIDDAEFDLLFISGLAQLVPADLVFAAILGDDVLRGLQREMRRTMGEVLEEGLSARFGIIEEFQRPVREHEGGIPLAFTDLRRVRRDLAPIKVNPLAGVFASLLREIQLAKLRRRRALETAFPRRRAVLLPEMPFPDDGRVIARRAEHLRHRHAAVIELCVRAFRLRQLQTIEIAHPGLMRIQTGHQRGPRGAAPRRVVKLREAHTARCQRIEIRCRDLAAVAAEIAESHVIDEDNEDVGPFSLGKSERRQGQPKKGRQNKAHEKLATQPEPPRLRLFSATRHYP